MFGKGAEWSSTADCSTGKEDDEQYTLTPWGDND
jgi:hypothetical protein